MAHEHELKRLLAAMAAVAVIALSIIWIVRYQKGQSIATLAPHQGLGRVMAEQTAKLLEKKEKKRILVIRLASSEPSVRAQWDAFTGELKRLGDIEISEVVELDPGENPKYRPGDGLSARRFARLVDKYEDVEGMVSFVGVPDPTDEEMQKLEDKPPRFIAFTRDLEKLPRLFKDRTLRVAIVPRYDFPAPGPESPSTPAEWFDKYFQIVTSNTLASVIQ